MSIIPPNEVNKSSGNKMGLKLPYHKPKYGLVRGYNLKVHQLLGPLLRLSYHLITGKELIFLEGLNPLPSEALSTVSD